LYKVRMSERDHDREWQRWIDTNLVRVRSPKIYTEYLIIKELKSCLKVRLSFRLYHFEINTYIYFIYIVIPKMDTYLVAT
jgi:hypothetical protein